MAKVNVRPPIERTTTHEGGAAVVAPLRTELLLTAVTTFLGEDTFYEKADARQTRLVELVQRATQAHPFMVAKTAVALRSEYRIRTAAILMAVEFGRAGGLTARETVDAVIQRPDECAEVIAYWQAHYGRSLPWWLRRGVADAATRVYTERNVLKYNSRNALVSPADVIELVHPKPQAEWQSALFKYLLDERHHGDGAERIDPHLEMIRGSITLGKAEPDNRRHLLREWGPEGLARRGYTWERLAGWLPGGMDAEAWEAVAPSMGVMALLRNLRNFDKAGISEAAVDAVIAKITDADEVRKSRIFPYRAYTAYREAPSDNWKRALNKTLDLASGNVPAMDRTLILVDVSGSMSAAVSNRSSVSRTEVAALMASVVHRVSTGTDVGVFAQGWGLIEAKAGWSVLALAKFIAECNGPQLSGGYGRISSPFGQSTMGHSAIAALFDAKRHDQVLMFTDDQMRDNPSLSRHVPRIMTFDLGSYRPVSDWGKGRIHVGGFSEAAFQVLVAS